MSQALISCNGTTGASTTAFAIRPLTTIDYQINPDGSAAAFATLAANVITLIAGTYRIEGICRGSGAAADSVGCRLYNVTDATAVAGTEDGQQVAVLNENVNMFFECAFTIAGSKNFRLEGKSSTANANGFGVVIAGAFINLARLLITKTA